MGAVHQYGPCCIIYNTSVVDALEEEKKTSIVKFSTADEVLTLEAKYLQGQSDLNKKRYLEAEQQILLCQTAMGNLGFVSGMVVIKSAEESH